MASATGQTTSGEASQLADITVTAQRREENLQSVPIAISTFNTDDIVQRNVVVIRDLANFAPNTQATPGVFGNPNDVNFFIRGIGQEDVASARDPGVGIYLDGVYIGRSSGASLEALDLERVEILRGPQGTLFGRNTIGGAVNIVTRMPGNELQAELRGQLGRRDRISASAYLSGPLVRDRLAASLSLSARQQDGWGFSTTTRRTLGDIDSRAGRAKLSWTPTSNLDVLLSADFFSDRGTVNPRVTVAFQPFTGNPELPFGITPVGVPLPPGGAAQVCPSGHCFRSFSGTDPSSRTDAWGIFGRIEWLIGAATLRSITSYRKLDQSSLVDVDATSFRVYDYRQNDLRQDQFSQELNLFGKALNNRLVWLIGLYFFKEDATQLTSVTFGSNVDVANPATLPGGRSIYTDQFISPATESYAAFSQITYRFTDRLSFTGGIRVTHEKKSMAYDIGLDNREGGLSLSVCNGINPNPVCGGQPLALLPPIRLATPIPARSESWDPVTWRAGLEYQAGEQVLLYGSVSTGFRSGGFNSRPVRPIDATSYDPEETMAYEVGIKSQLFDRRLRANLAAFFTDYRDIQFLRQIGSFAGIANGPEAEIKGAELELLALPARGLTVNANIGYQDAAYSKDVGVVDASGAVVLRGDPLPLSSKWSVALGARYQVDVNGLGNLAARADYLFRSRHTFFSDPTSSEVQPDFGIFNGRLEWTSPDERFSVAVVGNNILSKRYILFGFNNLRQFGFRTADPAPPADFWLEMRARF